MTSVNFLEELEKWFNEEVGRVVRADFVAELARSPEDGRDKASMWIDLGSSERIGQIIVWESGEAEIGRIHLPTDQATPESRRFASAEDLRRTAKALVDWIVEDEGDR